MAAWCHIGLQKAYTQNDRESSVVDTTYLQGTFLEESAFYNFFPFQAHFLSNVPGLWLLWCDRSLMMPNCFDVVNPSSGSSVQSLTWKQTVSHAIFTKVPGPNAHTHCKLWPLRSGCCKLFWTEYSCSHICQLIISLIIATSDSTSRKLGVSKFWIANKYSSLVSDLHLDKGASNHSHVQVVKTGQPDLSEPLTEGDLHQAFPDNNTFQTSLWVYFFHKTTFFGFRTGGIVFGISAGWWFFF